uniref:hypothetical protein n=1 Tax=Streptomyces corallincola TaxID=2851888 RepID=UPI0027E2CA46|nr:hypothetical protein [Streptomyces corallincola]
MALAPGAYAAEGGQGVLVTPAAPAPGADVGLEVRGCQGSEGTATSGAFVSEARLTGEQGTLSGDTRVRSAVTPGTYAVRVQCAGTVVNGTLTVTGQGAAQGTTPDTPQGTTPDTPQGTAPDADPQGTARGTAADTARATTPVAPVHAGGGGASAHFATVATTGSGPDTAQAVTGLALAGAAAGAVGLLRARRSRTAG